MKPHQKFKLKMALVVLAALGLGAYLTWTQLDNVYARLVLFIFQRDPSQATANTLVDLVDDQVVGPAQARRILARLLTPTVTKADAYMLGTVPTVRVELPFELTFQNMTGDVTEEVYVDGQYQYGTHSDKVRTIKAKTQALHVQPTPTRPGVYRMEIRYAYSLTAERKPGWQWTSFKGLPWPRHRMIDLSDTPSQERQYTCRFLIPLQIVVEDPARRPD